ncbi:MAG: 3-isopropylmalate dehydratase small subunit [Spirochaetes bacterium]|nr:3-isopropylmalate dehydratase small subunit [Spirochaetota bacterium]
MKNFDGKVLFLDRSDINTDEIIPAKYLTEITKAALKPYLLEDLKLAGFDPKNNIEGKKAVVTRENFGCGSSREHAPWALEVNDMNVVFAVNFARIFRQNMSNCGMLAAEMTKEDIDDIFNNFGGKETTVKVNINDKTAEFSSSGKTKKFKFNISDFDKALIEAGGWVDFANKRY